MAAPLVARFGTRQVVSVDGADAQAYLQGQLSQDIAALGVDDCALSLVLSPQGKIDAWVRVTRVGDTEFWLDVDTGFADGLATRLQRFLLRTDATITVTDLEVISFRVVDDGTGGAGDVALRPLAINRLPDDEHRVVPALGWPQPGADVIGDMVELRAFADRISEVEELDADGWQRLRILSGVPAMGTELVHDTIPAMAGIVDESVSFTKGCFTGQELVARIDSRGNRVPRFMCFGRAQGMAQPGADITDVDGHVIGTITSSVADPTVDQPEQSVTLGYVRRGTDLPVTAAVATGDRSLVPIRLQSVRSGR